MKDTEVVSNSAMFHWMESKIRAHVLYCVLALTVARLMVREAERAGVHISVRELLARLPGIQETALLYQGERGRPRARRMLTEQDATQSRLYELFGFDAYAPKRWSTPRVRYYKPPAQIPQSTRANDSSSRDSSESSASSFGMRI